MTVARLMKIAASTYSQESKGICTLPTLADARRHRKGDSLADFIVLELHDVLKDTPPHERRAAAIKALGSAKRQLGAIIYALTFAPGR